MALGCIEEDYPVRLVFPELTTAAASNITASSAVTVAVMITYEGSKWSNSPGSMLECIW